MADHGLGRRAVMAGVSGAAMAGALVRPVRAAAPTKITFLTSWFAEAEHGGFYQAKATGLYEKAGLDVEIKMGGPQVNGMQLLAGGAADIMIGFDIQVLKSIENGLPVQAVAAAFQFDLAGIMTHDDIKSLAALKGHKVLVSTAAYTTFWPWLQQKFGYTDDMAGVDTFNLQPFLVDKTVAMQGYASSEPFEAQRHGAKVNFLLFADDGYPPYSNTLVTTNAFIAKNPDAVAAFVKCSMLGWADYFKNPAPANKLIKIDNPKQPDDQIAFAIEKMRAMHVLDRGDAAKAGIGTMTDARWQATRDFLVKANLLKPAVDYKKAFTTRFTEGLHITA
jgi:NitT/TauT family transport system substrate-binding protein